MVSSDGVFLSNTWIIGTHGCSINLRDTDHMLLNRVRFIITAVKGIDNMKMTPQRWRFERSLGRFSEYGPTLRVNDDGKQIEKWPRPPWRAKPEDIHLVDEVFPAFVRLPQVCTYMISMYI